MTTPDRITELESALAAERKEKEAAEKEMDDFAVAIGYGETAWGLSGCHRPTGEQMAEFIKGERKEHGELLDAVMTVDAAPEAKTPERCGAVSFVGGRACTLEKGHKAVHFDGAHHWEVCEPRSESATRCACMHPCEACTEKLGRCTLHLDPACPVHAPTTPAPCYDCGRAPGLSMCAKHKAKPVDAKTEAPTPHEVVEAMAEGERIGRTLDRRIKAMQTRVADRPRTDSTADVREARGEARTCDAVDNDPPATRLACDREAGHEGPHQAHKGGGLTRMLLAQWPASPPVAQVVDPDEDSQREVHVALGLRSAGPGPVATAIRKVVAQARDAALEEVITAVEEAIDRAKAAGEPMLVGFGEGILVSIRLKSKGTSR